MPPKNSPKPYYTCTVQRTRKVTSYSLNIMTGARTDEQSYIETAACNVPLFDEAEHRTGVCTSCHNGWSVPDNTFANKAELDRAAAAW